MPRTSFALSDDSVIRELLEEGVSNVDSIEDALSLAESGTDHDFHVLQEAKELFHIAMPSVLIQFSLFFIFPLAASEVGRNVGTVELGGFSLGGLVGNLTCLSIMEGALTAGDTLMPRAFGAGDYREVARLAIRAALVCTILLIPPVLPLCWYADWILTSLGQDPQASELAQEWIRYYFIGVPPNMVFRIAMRFLLAQQRPWPLVYAAVPACLLAQPFFLWWLIPILGLPGSGLAISLTQWTTLLFLVLQFWINPPYKAETWPGLSPKLVSEALRPRPFLRFFSLSVGGIFSLSEWWFFEIMCFVAGSFGVTSLVVHTIAYNLVPLFFMLPLGILIGLSVRMGHVISYDPRRAKLMAAWSMAMIAVLGLVATTLLYTLRMPVIRLFTSDEEIIDGCLHIWPYVCSYIFLLYIFGISSAVYRGLGLQWRLASIVIVSLYLFLLPAVVYFAMIRGGGLYAQWKLLPAFYVVMQAVLIAGYVVVDWDDLSLKIRSGLRQSLRSVTFSPVIGKMVDANEKTRLLI